MSLATRLSAVLPSYSNKGGCRTCRWVAALPPGDRQAWDDWIFSDRSLSQLWEIAANDPDNPIPVGLSSMRNHVRSCKPDES